MNTHNQGKKIPMPAPKAQLPEREQFVNHPEFKDRISAAMEGVEFPIEKIPANLNVWLWETLRHIPYSVLGMPLPFYHQLINTPVHQMSFGLLQKACDIVFNAKPTDLLIADLSEYHNIILAVATMKDALSDITDPIRDKVIDDLMAAEKIKRSGLVTA
jgi:hypothetical protein